MKLTKVNRILATVSFNFFVCQVFSSPCTGPTQEARSSNTAQEVTTGEDICHVRPAVHMASI